MVEKKIKKVDFEAKTLQVKEVVEPQVDNTEVVKVTQQVDELKVDEPLIEDGAELKAETDGAESKPLDEDATGLQNEEEKPLVEEVAVNEAEVETDATEPEEQDEDFTELEVDSKKMFAVVNALKNFLFIGGNRAQLNKSNVQTLYRKFKKHGFIATMPIQVISMSDAKGKLEGRTLYEITVTRTKSNEVGIFSDFKLNFNIVQPENYHKYKGICVDGQHRLIALDLLKNNPKEEKEYNAVVEQITIPDGMFLLNYIACKNDVKAWGNNDFLYSNMPTGDERVDYIMAKMEEKKLLAIFLFYIYTLGTSTLTAKQVKSLMEGSREMQNFSSVQLSDETQKRGDEILETLINHTFIDKDRFTGRFAFGIKELYRTCKDIEQVKQVLEKIDKGVWEKSFTANSGSSLERKAYADALIELHSEMFGN